jgi:hypothetical protein
MGLLALLVACGSYGVSPSDTDSGSTVGTDCWWCVDTAEDTLDTGEQDTDKGSDDTGKDADDVLSGKLSSITGMGTLNFAAYDPSSYCGLSLEVVEATSSGTCSDCTTAFHLTLADTAKISKDGGGCGPGLDFEGATPWWGHGEDGALWSSADGESWHAEWGSSSKVAGMSWTWSLDI